VLFFSISAALLTSASGLTRCGLTRQNLKAFLTRWRACFALHTARHHSTHNCIA
jgi:hypothetical protein